jgi:hypothetical protein
MSHRRSATLQFNAIRLVCGLLPASLIEQIARQEAPGQKVHYPHPPEGFVKNMGQ